MIADGGRQTLESGSAAGTGERPGPLAVAATLSALEALACAALAVAVAGTGVVGRRDADPSAAVALALVFAALAAALGFAARGLWRVRRRPRAFAAVLHALAVLIGVSSVRGSPVAGLVLAAVGLGGLVALFAPASSRALGTGRLPGR